VQPTANKAAPDLLFLFWHFAFMLMGIILLHLQTHNSSSSLQAATTGAFEPKGLNAT
jgi:hypothetical protein